MDDKTQYRAEIDGLRAIAIITVVFYHYKIPPFRGGFIGVDVFFVISGYLITQLILRAVESGNFTLSHFYERRVRRILPALVLVLTFVVVGGLLIFPVNHFEALGRLLKMSSLFLGNYEIARSEVDYFAPKSNQNPLLHLWSLSLEEQFYLGFPLLIVLLARFGRRVLFSALAVIALVSLASAEWTIRRSSIAAFFFLQNRVWELLLGSLLATRAIAQPTSSFVLNGVSLFGLLSILGSAIAYRPMMHFPGLSALVPTVGTALIIWSGEGEGGWTHRLLRSRLLMGTGLLSYSLYLWHWPLLVYADSALPDPLGYFHRFALIGCSLVIAYLTFHFVEQPLRRGKAPRIPVLTLGCAVVLIGVFVGRSMQRTDGVLHALHRMVAPELNVPDSSYLTQKCPGRLCRFGNDLPTILIWGDSHGEMLAEGIGPILNRSGKSWALVASGGCPPLFDVDTTSGKKSYRCDELTRSVRKLLSEGGSVKDVLLIGRWQLYEEGERTGKENRDPVVLCPQRICASNIEEQKRVLRRELEKTVSTIQSLGARVSILGPVPEIGFNVASALRAATTLGLPLPPEKPLAQYLERANNALNLLNAMHKAYGVAVLYPHQVLCGDRCHIRDGDRPWYLDDNHLNPVGAEWMWKRLIKTQRSVSSILPTLPEEN